MHEIVAKMELQAYSHIVVYWEVWVSDEDDREM